MGKKEGVVYALTVDGRFVRSFSRKPPKSIIELTRLKGIEIEPPVEYVPRRKSRPQEPEEKQLTLEA